MKKVTKKKLELSEIVEKIKEQGLSYSEGAKEYGIKVKAIYDYNYRQKKEAARKSIDSNKASLADKKKIQLTQEEVAGSTIDEQELLNASDSASPLNLPQDIQRIIIQYRQDNPDHGFKRIENHLKNNYFVVVPRKKIREVLKQNDLLNTNDSSFDKPVEAKKGTKRFEAAYPRELYQIDVTYVYIKGLSVLYLINIIDDYSRFCVASELRTDQKGSTMIEILHRTIEQYGKPTKLLSDQGTSFYTWSSESTVFQKYLDDMKIEHIVADPHSPQTLGKVERLHQTIQRELLHKKHFNGYVDAKKGIAAVGQEKSEKKSI